MFLLLRLGKASQCIDRIKKAVYYLDPKGTQGCKKTTGIAKVLPIIM